jgi:hypothetical protein
MKKLWGKLDELFTEITFVEERDFRFLRDDLKKAAEGVEDAFTAVAFAEEGQVDVATNDTGRHGDGPERLPLPSTRKNNRLCTDRG